jgi:hypothetical protein
LIKHDFAIMPSDHRLAIKRTAAGSTTTTKPQTARATAATQTVQLSSNTWAIVEARSGEQGIQDQAQLAAITINQAVASATTNYSSDEKTCILS